MMDGGDILNIIHSAISDDPVFLEQHFDMFRACLGQGDGSLFFVLLIIFFDEKWHQDIDLSVQVRAVLGRSGDD